MFFTRPGACLAVLAPVLALAPLVSAQQPDTKKGSSELDAFMERVLARREVNRRVLNDYILDETEDFAILGPGRFPLYRSKGDYTWFVRDGIHVRSPLKKNGVPVEEDARVRYEERWLRREKARAERRRKEAEKKADERTKEPGEIAITGSGIEISGSPITTEPQFVSSAYFMDFKFEPGNYYLAGREKLEGQDVLRIEYYPTRMFDDDDPPEKRRRDRGQQEEDEIMRKMNKTALVTLWVDPKEHQIVKYVFENVWLDFLPGGWLVRVDDMRASMGMFQPFPGVWLPKAIDVGAGVTFANGSFDATYERRFAEYRQAEVKSKIRIPKGPDPDPPSVGPDKGPRPDLEVAAPEGGLSPFSTIEQNSVPSGEPFEPVTVAAAEVAVEAAESGPLPLQAEIVREVRVHGNAAVPDAEVLKIAGISVGATLAPDALAAIERRLKDSGRFETVQVRKRYRSLSDASDVALVLVVHEKVGVTATPSGQIERPILRTITSRIMFLPILSYADGYGFTYGARFGTVDLFGLGERLSLPLTWGGTRRVALEAERTFDRGPLTRVLGSAALLQRENPGFVFEPEDDDSTTDRRFELKARAERAFGRFLFTGLEATRSRIEFGPFPRQHQWTIGADAALDTRGDPNFPANAIYLGAGWNALHHHGLAEPVHRYRLDARGYLRPIGQPVLAGRVQYLTADGPLPVHERYLVGGSESLRGFRAGALNGTKFVLTSAELRVPITSVLSDIKLGLNVFMDAANKRDLDGDIDGRGWRRSAGAGLFIIAPLVKINMDIGRELREGGGTRLHLSSGFSF